MSDKAGASCEAEAPNSQAWEIAKWLIPSVSALFIVIGYVAKLAHHSLVGFNPGLSEPNEYLATTADFITWVFELPLDGWDVWCNAFFEGPHRYIVPLALALGVGLPLLRLLVREYKGRKGGATSDAPVGGGKAAKMLESCARWLPLASLVVVVGLRFVTMDVPLTRLEGFLVPIGDFSAPGDARADLLARLSSDSERSHWPQRQFSDRALTLWKAMSCTHGKSGPDPAPSKAPLSIPEDHRQDCSSHDVWEAQANEVAGEGLAHLLVTLMVLLLAIRVLRVETSKVAVSVACLSIFSCLSLAVTFGKLGHSLQYEFSTLVLKDPGNKDAPPNTEASQAERTASMPEGGVVLQTTSDWVTVARAEPINSCEHGVKLWRISKGEVRWQRHIFRMDLLGWSISNHYPICGKRPTKQPATTTVAPVG